jgi:hypothetical protein
VRLSGLFVCVTCITLNLFVVFTRMKSQICVFIQDIDLYEVFGEFAFLHFKMRVDLHELK